MKVSDWEFKNRAMIFGLIFGAAFPLYVVDPQNSAVALADAFAGSLHLTPDALARILFVAAALVMVAAAWTRTWASSYLDSSVVYAATIKSESLVADGPYRYVRNPLYFANVLMAVSLGALMSRLGMAVALIAMLVFCYRLILREERELSASRGAQYQAYREVVPRLWPSLRARIGKSARQPVWSAGFKAESWYWGIAVSVIAFALTLKVAVFFVILGASILLFWARSWAAAKKHD
jgi:protein-S-isoprenylcysteine O-methyltransferase Ste14